MTNEELRKLLDAITAAKRMQAEAEKLNRFRQQTEQTFNYSKVPVPEPEVEPGFDNAKRLVPCDRCGVLTANPKRLWRAGRELGDVCNPCANKQKI